MFRVYFVKECFIGLILGSLFGSIAFITTLVWLRDASLAATVGLAMAVTVAIAPVVALFMAKVLQTEHKDPAIGAGPFTTIIQDLISILIYFAIAGAILFS
jgi:magnesium transporter